jgi:thiol-disulfide isomerase/thioredoxin
VSIAAMLFLSIIESNAQIKTLSIGNYLPDVELKNIINSSKSRLRLSDLKGRYVILDFWNHNCHYCLASFKNIDSMQKKFAGKLQIVLVNKESKEFTEKFFQTHPQVKPPAVPLATGNGQFIDLFPKDGYPYSVWIDKNGRIKQMALAHNITTGHVKDFIEEKPLTLNNATRKIFYGPLFNYQNDSLEKKIIFFSGITRYIDDLNIGFTELSKYDDSLVELSSSGSSIIELYKKAFSEGAKYNFSGEGSVVLKVKDSNLYVRSKDPERKDDWDKEHSYNYTLFIPVSKHREAYKIMQQDLQRYFGLKARVITKSENEKPSHVLVIEE